MRTIQILPLLTLLTAATASCGASATLLRETDAGGDESSPGSSGNGSTAASGSNGGGASGSASSGSSSTPASGSISGSSTGGGSGSAPGGTGASGSASSGAGTSGSASSGAGGLGADAGMGSCVHDSDCPAGGLCGYPEKAACSATGQCFPPPKGPMCNAIVAGCACDGTLTNLGCNGLPSGYAPKPLRYSGLCMDGGAGAGSCVHDSDCASGQYCGFPISATCSATGQCLPTPKGPACMSISQGCGCDGTAVGIPCDRLPSAPVRHSGACSSGPTGSTCTVNADCRTFSDYCAGCNCDALAVSDPNPSCISPVNCFADPCLGHTAVCDSTHHCAIQ